MATAPAATTAHPATEPTHPAPKRESKSDLMEDVLVLLATVHLRGDRKYDAEMRAKLMLLIDKMDDHEKAEAKARLE